LLRLGAIIGKPLELIQEDLMVGTLLLIVLVVLLLGALPSWPYSRGWGYRPSGLFGVVLLIVIVLLLLGYL
jgi:hypothetical protein